METGGSVIGASSNREFAEAVCRALRSVVGYGTEAATVSINGITTERSPDCAPWPVAGAVVVSIAVVAAASGSGSVAAGITNFAPQLGQIPRFPAKNSLTCSACPFGQENRIPILGLMSTVQLVIIRVSHTLDERLDWIVRS
jgi:hypothetical protein